MAALQNLLGAAAGTPKRRILEEMELSQPSTGGTLKGGKIRVLLQQAPQKLRRELR
jgi:hypothetical protein